MNFLGINFYVQIRQVFSLYRLNSQRFLTLRLYLKFGLYRISVDSRLGLHRFHYYTSFPGYSLITLRSSCLLKANWYPTSSGLTPDDILFSTPSKNTLNTQKWRLQCKIKKKHTLNISFIWLKLKKKSG